MKLAAQNYHTSQSMGCCGMLEVYRLNGIYKTPTEIASAHARVNGDTSKISIKSAFLHQLIERYAPYHEDNTGQSYELADGFLAVLSFIWMHEQNRGYTTLFLSDNMGSEGDVHLGDFSTKNFMEWFIDEELGVVATTPDTVKSHKGTQQPIRAWIVQPDWKKINLMFAPACKRILTKIKDINRGRKDQSTSDTPKTSLSFSTATLGQRLTGGGFGGTPFTGATAQGRRGGQGLNQAAGVRNAQGQPPQPRPTNRRRRAIPRVR